MTTINFKTSKRDFDLILAIAKRAIALGDKRDSKDIRMDITAVHLNHFKLRLKDLLKANDSNFIHDINGIALCLNRQTGKLEKFFFPFFAEGNCEE